MMATAAARAWWKWLALCGAAGFAAAVFHAWLAPRNMSLWLGAWITGLCT